MVNFVVSLLMTSLVMSVIILAIVLFNRLFPRIFSAKVRYAIWLVILIGLILPFRPVIGNGIVQITLPGSANKQTENVDAISVDEPVLNEGTMQNETDNETIENSTIPIKFSNLTLGILIWGIVAIIIFLVQMFRYMKFVRMIKRWGIQVNDEKILEVFQSVKEQLGLSDRKVNIKVCKFVSSSMLTGFLYPVILLPENHFDEDELQLIFMHELVHFKRHDLLVKLLIVAVTCLHWFNPIVYWMCAEMQTDGEASCDEAVLQNADAESRRFYGEIIIGMIGDKNEMRTALSTCFYAGKSNMKRRLDCIMDTGKKMKKPAVSIIVLVAVLTLLSGSVFAFSNNNAVQTKSYEISEEQAKETALVKVGGGTVTKCNLDYENGRKVYEIEIIYGNKKFEMDIDVETSGITDYKEETINHPETSAAPSATQEATEVITSPISTEITAERAKEIALAKVGGGTVTECKIDYENGRKVYEIEIIYGNKKFEMDIDVETSNITDYKEETINHPETSAAPSATQEATEVITSPISTEITAERAKEIALAKVGGGTVTECKIDYENGRKVYEIEIIYGSKKYEIEIDVINSTITKYEIETLKTSNPKSNKNHNDDHDDDNHDDHD